MKFVLLIYQAKDYNPASLGKEEYKAVAAGYAAVNARPNVRPGLPLGLLEDAVTVRVGDGAPLTTPGPYVRHPAGSVGGYLEFEAETLEEAIQLATRVPAAGQGGAVEVRSSKVYW
jgi:hypothetical protein